MSACRPENGAANLVRLAWTHPQLLPVVCAISAALTKYWQLSSGGPGQAQQLPSASLHDQLPGVVQGSTASMVQAYIIAATFCACVRLCLQRCVEHLSLTPAGRCSRSCQAGHDQSAEGARPQIAARATTSCEWAPTVPPGFTGDCLLPILRNAHANCLFVSCWHAAPQQCRTLIANVKRSADS